MKKVLSLCVCLALWATGYAAESKMATEQEIEQFFTDTTYVVLTNDNIVLDALLREAVKKSWKVTPYKVIGNKEFEALRVDAKKSFLLISKAFEGKEKSRRMYLYVSILSGNAGAKETLGTMAELSSLPLACESLKGEINSFLLEPAVLFVQKNVEDIKNKVFDKKLLLSTANKLSAYNYNIEKLKGKTIYVAQDQIGDKVNIDKVKGQFGSSLVIVENQDALEEIVKKGDPQAVIAFSVFPQGSTGGVYAHKIAVALDGNLHYYFQEKNAKNFRFHPGDFDQWLRGIK